eukprot:4387935-Pleurochrysis_carterae.AAC.1
MTAPTLELSNYTPEHSHEPMNTNRSISARRGGQDEVPHQDFRKRRDHYLRGSRLENLAERQAVPERQQRGEVGRRDLRRPVASRLHVGRVRFIVEARIAEVDHLMAASETAPTQDPIHTLGAQIEYTTCVN